MEDKLDLFLKDYNLINIEILEVEQKLGLNFKEAISYLINNKFLEYGINTSNLNSMDVEKINSIIRNDLLLSFLHAVNFNVSDDNKYFILKYNTRYMKFYKYSDVARSLVVSREVDNVSVISYGFHKFYNLGEKGVFIKDVQKEIDESTYPAYYADKLDGTNITARKLKSLSNDCLLINTTGSLSKEVTIYGGKEQPNYILEAESYINENKNYLTMIEDNIDIAFIFELIGPNNVIVVSYDKSDYGLYLIGARKFLNKEGTLSRLLTQEELLELSNKYNVQMTQVNIAKDVESIVNYVNGTDYSGKEGVVIYVNDSIYKVKADDYVLTHHLYMKKSLKTEKDLKEFINIIVPLVVNESFDDYLGVFKGNVPSYILEIAEKASNTLEVYDMIINSHLEKGKHLNESDFSKSISLNSEIDKNLKGIIICCKKSISVKSKLSNLIINSTFNELKSNYVYSN